MNPWINYHHLNYFRVIATEGSIARAAEKLRLGQPTLSLQLKQFEETIGVTLFARQHKKLTLTEEGRAALKYANEIFRLGNEMLEMLHDKMATNLIHVQIGALDSVPKVYVQEIVKAALNIAPCTVSILEGKGDELIRELSLHRIDLMISNYLPGPHEGRGFYSRSLGKAPVALFGASKFKGLKKNFPHSLDKAPVILPTQHSKLRQDLESFFRAADLSVHVVAETQDSSLQNLLGASGLGLLPLPKLTDRAPTTTSSSSSGTSQLFEIGRLPGVFEEYHLVTASRKIENPVSSKLMKSFQL